MGQFKDLRGQKFGKLTVIDRVSDSPRIGDRRPRVQWLCGCDCGQQIIVRSDHLLSGETQSCGCYQKKRAGEANRRTTPFIIRGDVAIGKTSQGIEFYIDAKDVEKVSDMTWHVNAQGYLQTNMHGDRTSPLLHKIILGDYGKGFCVDHIDRNKLNNRRSNLRICRQNDNAKNASLRSDNTSGYTGVYYDARRGKWWAGITSNGISYYLGSFEKKDDAIAARLDAETKYFGEFAPQRADNVYFSVRGW